MPDDTDNEISVEENLWAPADDAPAEIEPYSYAGQEPVTKNERQGTDNEPDGGDGDTEEEDGSDAEEGEGDGDEAGDVEEETGESEEVEEKPEEEKEETEEQAEERVFTLKVDGEEIEKNEEEVVTLAQKGLHAQKTLAEARQKEEDIQWIKDTIMNDPMKVARQLIEVNNPNLSSEQVEGAIYEYLEREFAAQYSLINSPKEQQQALLAQRKLERIEKENEQLRQQQVQRQNDEKIADEERKFHDECTSAMSAAGLPDNDDVRILMVEAILAREEDPGAKELTTRQVADIVKSEYEERVANRVHGLTYEDLEKHPDLLKKMRQADVEALKQRSTPQKAQGTSVKKKKPATSRRRRRKSSPPKDFRTLLEERT
jgi:hypothetical protein